MTGSASDLTAKAQEMADSHLGRGSLIERIKPFPKHLIHTNPSGGGEYVKHSVVVQRLLDLFGSYDFEVAQVIRGRVEGKAPNPQANSKRGKDGAPTLDDAVVGAVCRLTVDVEGRRTTIEDVGDCEDPHNWPHDGARLKDATSDAIKRCAARLGVGLHLWAQGESYLYQKLKDAEGEQ